MCSLVQTSSDCLAYMINFEHWAVCALRKGPKGPKGPPAPVAAAPERLPENVIPASPRLRFASATKVVESRNVKNGAASDLPSL